VCHSLRVAWPGVQANTGTSCLPFSKVVVNPQNCTYSACLHALLRAGTSFGVCCSCCWATCRMTHQSGTKCWRANAHSTCCSVR
jgi:hypothetical protein